MQFRTVFAALILLTNCSLFAQNLNTVYRSKISYPGQTLANVWGYVAEGKEYALVGGSKGLIIVDITNPDTPQQIVQIPGPDNLWKEIKTFQHYAYVTSEGGQGIQVVDLSGLPSSNLQSHFYMGDGAIQGQLNAIHALHIDETKGFLYAWGGNLFSGGAKIFDLKADPYNPVYVGKYDQLGYIHDGYVDNDTMYSGHIYAGQFAIVNMADKTAPELINTQTTPNAFTHNTWLTPDRHTILATDEVNNSFLSTWDVSDPTDIKFLDKIQSNPGSNSIVHNTYAIGNWAVTSWYKDGFTIVDVTRPDNLVQVGDHDTAPNESGSNYGGCWGVYPYFPSGNIIASNIGAPGELWVVTPTYVRACYLEGKVTDAVTGANLPNAQIQVLGSNPLLQELSAINGDYKTGQAAEGYFKVQISKSGYQDFESVIYFQRGEVVNLNAALYPVGQSTVSGTVVRHSNGTPVAGATVWLFGPNNFAPVTTDASGAFNFDNVPSGTYSFLASAPNTGYGELSGQLISGNTNVVIELFRTPGHQAIQREGASLAEGSLQIHENPFGAETMLEYRIPAGSGTLLFLNSLGQTVQQIEIKGEAGQLRFGADVPAGVYFAVLKQEEVILQVEKLIKR